MNKEYKVRLRKERDAHYLSVTHNGYQWISIPISDPGREIPLIIEALKSYYVKGKKPCVECGSKNGHSFGCKVPKWKDD